MRQLLIRICLAMGIVCALYSVCTPWFQIPTSTISLQDQPQTVTTDVSCWAIVFQVITIFTTGLSVGMYYLRPQRQSVAIAIAAAGLTALLFFPHVQQTRQPRLTAQASWLQIQHENLTWFGGDIFRGQELEGSPAQIQMYLSDSPRHVTVMKLPIWSLQTLGLNSLPSLIEWLGYTNTFCQFVARGWTLSIAGLGCVLLAMIFQQEARRVASFKTAIQTTFCCGLIGLVFAWQAPVRASSILQQAADATQRGDHTTALEYLTDAATIWPPLKEDTWFVTQIGLSQSLLGIRSPASALHEARCLERDKQFDRAAHSFRELAAASDNDLAVRREACRGMLRQAIRALSSGERAKAIDSFEFVVSVEPANIKSLFALQLAYLQQGDRRRAKLAHAGLVQIYEHLHFPNKKIVIAKSEVLVAQPQVFQSESDRRAHATQRDRQRRKAHIASTTQ
jgi:hypothetical protein